MGCTLYPAGSPAGYTLRGYWGHAHESKLCRKGWSPRVEFVCLAELLCKVGCVFENPAIFVIYRPVCTNVELSALVAHSCTFIGLSVGNAARSNVPPLHTGSCQVS